MILSFEVHDIIIEEPQILTSRLDAVPIIQELCSRYRLDWMATFKEISLNIVWEFYASYASMVIKRIPKKSKAFDQPPLLQTLVHDVPVDIFEVTVCQFLFGPDFLPLVSTKEYDYRLGLARDR